MSLLTYLLLDATLFLIAGAIGYVLGRAVGYQEGRRDGLVEAVGIIEAGSGGALDQAGSESVTQ